MTTHAVSSQDMLNDLLLNQALHKREIARIVSISKQLIDRILLSNDELLEAQPLARLNKLYLRLKQYEDVAFEGDWVVNDAYFNH